MNERRLRYRRRAKLALIAAAIALSVALLSFFALPGEVGGVVFLACFLAVVVAQGVFFWAFIAGKLYKEVDDSHA